MAKIQVYAKKASALNIKHPVDGPLRADGSGMWDEDGFTFRRLRDGAITRNQAEAFKVPAPAAQPVDQPAAQAAAAKS